MNGPYRILIAAAADRIFKKLQRRIREKIKQELAVLKTNPYAGEQLAGPLDFLYSYHFTVFGKYFRAAYTIETERKSVTLQYIGPRGEFYKRLRRLFH